MFIFTFTLTFVCLSYAVTPKIVLCSRDTDHILYVQSRLVLILTY